MPLWRSTRESPTPRPSWTKGIITDKICGAGKHKDKDAVLCVFSCVKTRGSEYVLVVGKDIYRIENADDQSVMSQLAANAAKEVQVTGTVNKTVNTIKVETI